MEIQIRTSKLSAYQVEKEQQYIDAVEILRENGFPAAQYYMTVTTKETEEPGYISL